MWRARLSIPSLLAGSDERRVLSLAVAVNGGTAIFIISALAWLLDLPLLFPALGPSAFILFSRPFSVAAAPRSVILGHSSAIVAGYAIWGCVSLVTGKAVHMEAGGLPVFASASLALALTCVLLVSLSCLHAPACATALIIALGAANGPTAFVGMAIGVVLLTAQAVVMHRIANVKAPVWSPRSDDTPGN
jgi:CBS-domain-containing membrane protein